MSSYLLLKENTLVCGKPTTEQRGGRLVEKITVNYKYNKI